MDTKDKYDLNARWYDLFELIAEALVYAHWRRLLFSRVELDRFLEIGVGTGKNLRYYPKGAKATAIDFSDRMLSYARRRATRIGPDISLRSMDVQHLRFGANAFPSVIATFVFCSVPDPVRGLKELNRVCSPNGRIVLLEHVRPQNRWLGKLFDSLNHLTVKATGVNINRNTLANMRKAGLEIELKKNLFLDVFKLIVARPGKAIG